MLDLVDETAPPQSAVSLNHPRKVNCIGSVQILASRPIMKTNLSYLMLRYLFLIHILVLGLLFHAIQIVSPLNFSFHPQALLPTAHCSPAHMTP